MPLVLTDAVQKAIPQATLDVVERHDYEGHEHLNLLLEQVRQAQKHGRARCQECSTRKAIWKMYRCYYCGFWVCDDCGKEHFGENREDWFCDGGRCE